MLCAIWYHLYNLKNVKNTHGRVLLLVKLKPVYGQYYDKWFLFHNMWTFKFIMREIVSNLDIWYTFLNMALWAHNAHYCVPSVHGLYIAHMVSLFIMRNIVSYFYI